MGLLSGTADTARGAWLRRALGAMVIGVGVAHVLARIMPDEAGPEALLWFWFMVRTTTLHAGCVVLLLSVVALRVGARRSAWAGLVLSALLLLPAAWSAWPRSPEVPGSRFTLASFNLWGYRNEQLDLAVAAIRSCEADVVCIQEYTSDFHRSSGGALAEAYPHRIVDDRPGIFGSAIYSRLPLRASGALALQGDRTDCTHCTIQIDGRRITLFNVHLWHYGFGQRRQLEAILRRAAGLREPQIWVGDFNFTQYSRAAGRLADAGFRDVLDLAGSGLKTTWPINRRGAFLLYPGFRIDHAYLSSELTASRAYVADVPGADHRQVFAEVGFARSEP